MALRVPQLGRTITGADGANREFGKMIDQGGHVTPSIESNPMTACTRIGIHRFFEAAEGSEKGNINSIIQSFKQLSYKVEMHMYATNRGAALLMVGAA